jgi:hypothetical protein
MPLNKRPFGKSADTKIYTNCRLTGMRMRFHMKPYTTRSEALQCEASFAPPASGSAKTRANVPGKFARKDRGLDLWVTPVPTPGRGRQKRQSNLSVLCFGKPNWFFGFLRSKIFFDPTLLIALEIFTMRRFIHGNLRALASFMPSLISLRI